MITYTLHTTDRSAGETFKGAVDMRTLLKLDRRLAELIGDFGERFVYLKLETDDSILEITKQEEGHGN